MKKAWKPWRKSEKEWERDPKTGEMIWVGLLEKQEWLDEIRVSAIIIAVASLLTLMGFLAPLK